MQDEDTKRAFAAHMEQTTTQDRVVAAVAGVLGGLAVWFILAFSGVGVSGGVSPTMTNYEGWPVLGVVVGLVTAGVGSWGLYRHLRRGRTKRYWDQARAESELTRGL